MTWTLLTVAAWVFLSLPLVLIAAHVLYGRNA